MLLCTRELINNINFWRLLYDNIDSNDYRRCKHLITFVNRNTRIHR